MRRRSRPRRSPSCRRSRPRAPHRRPRAGALRPGSRARARSPAPAPGSGSDQTARRRAAARWSRRDRRCRARRTPRHRRRPPAPAWSSARGRRRHRAAPRTGRIDAGQTAREASAASRHSPACCRAEFDRARAKPSPYDGCGGSARASRFDTRAVRVYDGPRERGPPGFRSSGRRPGCRASLVESDDPSGRCRAGDENPLAVEQGRLEERQVGVRSGSSQCPGPGLVSPSQRLKSASWRTIDPWTSLIPPGELPRIDGISVARPYRASEVRPQRSAQLAGWARCSVGPPLSRSRRGEKAGPFTVRPGSGGHAGAGTVFP